MGREQGNENESVLGVLMHAQELRPRPPRRLFAGKMIDLPRASRETALHPYGRANRKGAGRLLPHGQIGPVVADIVEAALAEGFDEPPRLLGSGEVHRLVGREPAREKSEMVGDRLDQPAVARGSEVDRPARGPRLPDDSEDLLVVGEQAWIEIRRC